jgi:hypothetical protein
MEAYQRTAKYRYGGANDAVRDTRGVGRPSYRFKPIDTDPWTAADVEQACGLMFQNIHEDATKDTTLRNVRDTIVAMIREDRRRLQSDYDGLIRVTRENVISIAFTKYVSAVVGKLFRDFGRMDREQTLQKYVKTVEQWRRERQIETL